MASHRPRNGKILAGIIEETLMLDMAADFYRVMQERVRQYSNISLELVEISKDDLNVENTYESSELPMNMDVLVVPFEYTLLSSYEKLNISKLTRLHYASSTFLLSPAPEPTITASSNLIAVEPIVSWLLLFFWLLVSAVMSLAITKRFKVKRNSTTKNCWLRFKNFTPKFKAHLWQNANLLFCEGFPRIPRSLPWRIAFMSWSLVVMVLCFEISSFLKSEFSETKYVKVDTIDDLLKQAGKIKIGIMEGGVEDHNLAKKALTEPKFQRLQEILKGDPDIGEKMRIAELITGEVLEQVADRKLIFVSGMIVFLPTMRQHYYNEKNLFDFNGIYYFSKPIDQSYAVYLFSTSFAGTPRSSIINEVLAISDECQLIQPIKRHALFMIEILGWSEPAHLETSKLTLKGAESVVVLYFIANAIAIAYFLLTTFSTLFINLYKSDK